MSSGRSRSDGSRNVQRLIRARRVLPEPPLPDGLRQIAVGAGDQLEIAVHFAVRAQGRESLFLQGAQQHGLLVQAQLADLVQEEESAIRRDQESLAGPAWRP